MALPISMKRFDAGIQNVILDYELTFKIDAIVFYVNLYFNPSVKLALSLISLFDKVHFYIFVMLIELVRVRVRSINLNQKDIGIHSNLEAPQAPSGCHVARC